jgi:hypothetical protein
MTLNGKWILEGDFDTVVSKISLFECAEVVLVVKPILIQPDFVIFGCYIPTIPRLTSIISGRIVLRRLLNNQTEIQAIGFRDWAAPFVKSLMESLEGQEGLARKD